MRRQLTDRNALAVCETTLKESQKRLDFLEAEYRKLQNKRRSKSDDATSVGSSGSGQSAPFQGYNTSESLSSYHDNMDHSGKPIPPPRKKGNTPQDATIPSPTSKELAPIASADYTGSPAGLRPLATLDKNPSARLSSSSLIGNFIDSFRSGNRSGKATPRASSLTGSIASLTLGEDAAGNKITSPFGMQWFTF